MSKSKELYLQSRIVRRTVHALASASVRFGAEISVFHKRRERHLSMGTDSRGMVSASIHDTTRERARRIEFASFLDAIPDDDSSVAITFWDH